MNIKEVKELIRDILQSDITEFELEHTGTKVRLRRGLTPGIQGVESEAQPIMTRLSPIKEPAQGIAGFHGAAAAKEEQPANDGLHVITSPIVGTFYRAHAPGTEPYVQTGSKVEIGAILCIVEAMKLMNEIPSDVAGEIVEIFVENGQPIEFGQKLFSIRIRD